LNARALQRPVRGADAPAAGSSTRVSGARASTADAPTDADGLTTISGSADIDGDLVVDLVDLSRFAMSYPPHAYSAEADFDFDGEVGLLDFAFFSAHFGHVCP
jgi:hypothetical protein